VQVGKIPEVGRFFVLIGLTPRFGLAIQPQLSRTDFAVGGGQPPSAPAASTLDRLAGGRLFQ
jgi:hypothetical protein